jgi:hypothetical protein
MHGQDHHGWEWIGDGAGIELVDLQYWEHIGRRAGVHDAYRAKAAFVCGAVREFLRAARLCYDAELYLGASLLLMPPLEMFGRCVTGDRVEGRKERLREGIGLLNHLQRPSIETPLNAEPVRAMRNFLAGGAVAMDSEAPASLAQPTIDLLGRGLALALDRYWGSQERRLSFAETKLTALQAGGNPIYVADMAGHFANGHRPSDGLTWAPPT